MIDPADGKRSLREAITAANTLAGADVIVLPAGVFKIALAGAGENGNATGDFDITGAVTIQGAGAGLTIIDGQQLDRVFDVVGTAPSSIKVVLQGLTVRNGNVTGDGGGIRVGNADLVVRDCVVDREPGLRGRRRDLQRCRARDGERDAGPHHGGPQRRGRRRRRPLRWRTQACSPSRTARSGATSPPAPAAASLPPRRR